VTASANGRRPRSPSLRLTVELGDALAALAQTADSLRRTIEADVEGAMRSLGLNGHAQVELRAGKTARPLRVWVNGAVQPYPPVLVRRAWIAVAPPELRSRAAATNKQSPGAYPSAWLAEYVQELESSDTAGWSFLAEVVRRLTLAILLERPSRLVGDGQVTSYARATSLPPRAVAPALRRLLDLGVSVREVDVVAETVREGEEIHRPREDTVEAAFAQLRSHAAELRVHPDTLAVLLEGPPPSEPISVHAPAVPEDVRASFAELEQMFFTQFGFQLPELTWVSTPSIPEGMLSVRLEEWTGLPIPLVVGEQLIVDAEPEGLPVPSLGTAVHPVTGAARAIVDRSAKSQLDDAGYVTRGPIDWVVVNVFAEAAANADRLLGLEDVEYQLARLNYQLVRLDNGDHVVVEGTYPALVDTVLARYTLGDLTRILRAMTSEGLSIHNLPSILERLLEYDTVACDPTATIVLDDRLPLAPGTQNGWEAMYAALRRGLRSQISHRFTWAENTVVAYVLEPKLEARLATGIQRTHGIPTRPLPDQEAEAFRDAVWQELSHAGNGQAGPVVLTTEGVRASVRRLLEPELPDLPVLSYAELRSDVNVQPLARIPVK
jgi:flagellar biosynthesis component FlhA